MHDKNYNIIGLPIYKEECSLSVSCFCILASIMVIPIWCVQVSNCIKKTTTHRRFAYKPKKDENITELSDLSDTKSMLIRETDDWTADSPINSKIGSTSQVPENDTCCKRKNTPTKLKVNETVYASWR